MRSVASVSCAALLMIGIGALVPSTDAAPNNLITSSVGNAFNTLRIYSGVRSTAPFDLREATGTGETNLSMPLAFTDPLRVSTGVWISSFSPARYFEFDFSSPLPGGLPISDARFNFTFASAGGPGSGTACVKFDVLRVSDGAVLGTHGSDASPSGCTTTLFLALSILIPEINNSTLFNDLKIRVYGRESGNKAFSIDMATTTGTALHAYTVYPDSWTDLSNGSTPITTRWSLSASADNSTYATVEGWSSAFNTKYIKMSAPTIVPDGATMESASFTLSYRSDLVIDTTCLYLETYSGTTMLASHGSATNPLGCNSSINFATITESLPEASDPTKADSLVIRVYMRNSGGRKAQVDLARLSATFFLV